MNYSLRNVKRCHFEIIQGLLNTGGTIRVSPKGPDNVTNLDLLGFTTVYLQEQERIIPTVLTEKKSQNAN